ncbi:hypothetical protein [Glutamicibacter sp. X7]
MATRKTPKKKNTSTGHPARSASTGTAPFEAEVRQALQPFKQQLFAHFQREGQPTSETRAAFEGLTTLLTVHAQLRKSVDVTTFDEKVLGEQLGHLASLGSEASQAGAALLKHYLVFLGNSANFGGSVDDFKETFEFLSRMSGDSPIVVPFMEDEEANAALEQMPFVFAARELIRWVGEGQRTDPQGVLHGEELSDAAGALGLTVTVEANAEQEPTQPWEPADGTVVAQLRQIPRLAALWDALIGTAMLRYEAPNAVPTESLREALLGSTGPGSRLIKELIAEVIFSHVLLNALGTEGQRQVAEMVAGVLTNAASTRPPRTEFALQVPVAEDLPEEQRHLIPLLQESVPQVETLLRIFEREGMVQIEESIVVPEVLRAALERALEKVSDQLLASAETVEPSGEA